MTDPLLRPMKITIGNERFQIQTDLSEEELRAIAEYLEDKMRIHLVPGLRTDPKKQLLLMAMEISAELFATRQRLKELEQRQERIGERAIQWLTSLEYALEGGNSSVPVQTEDPQSAAEVFLDGDANGVAEEK